MATQTLIIKNGLGAETGLAVNSSSFGLVPEHTLSGTINITSSLQAPLYVSSSHNSPVLVTGTVSVSNPVDVTVTVADIISVTSSLVAPLFISSSHNSPVLITGTVGGNINVNNFPAITQVTSSVDSPVYVNSVGGIISAIVTSSLTFPVYVSSSENSPVLITGTVGGNVNINNLPAVTIVTSSVNYPVYTKQVLGLATAKNRKSTFGDVDYTNDTSGTFELAAANSSRIGLIISNGDAANLYITLGSGSKNGFELQTTASAPTSYSFILYTSGTYIADASTVGLFHGGFFISSSNVAGAALITSITS